jgi:hypothetical protein
LIVVGAVLLGGLALMSPPAEALDSGGCSKDGLVLIGPITGAVSCTTSVSCPSTSTTECAQSVTLGIAGTGSLGAYINVGGDGVIEVTRCGPVSRGCTASGTLFVAPGGTATLSCFGYTPSLALFVKLSCT